MRADATALLRCPACAAPLGPTGRANGGAAEITNGELACANAHRFPVRRGVPRFVPDQTYSARFGFQWQRFARTALDSTTGRKDAYQTFRQKTGIEPDDLHGRTVLDVGCGMGRFMEVCARTGARVYGADLSLSVDAAAANLAPWPNAIVVQADLFRLPFADAAFDMVYSIGVLEHTPDPRAAFRALPRLVRPGGTLAVWVHSGHWRQWAPHLLGLAYRQVTKRLPPGLLLAACRAVAPLGRLHRVPLLGHLTYCLLPVSRHPDPETRIMDTFNWYAPPYRSHHTVRDVMEWFREAGFEAIRPLPTPVAVSGRRLAP